MSQTHRGDKEHSGSSSDSSKADDGMMFGDMDELSGEPSIKIHGRAGRMPFGGSEEEQDCQEDYQNLEDDGDADGKTSPTNDMSSGISLRSTISGQMWGDGDSILPRSANERESLTLQKTSEKMAIQPLPTGDLLPRDTPQKGISLLPFRLWMKQQTSTLSPSCPQHTPQPSALSKGMGSSF